MLLWSLPCVRTPPSSPWRGEPAAAGSFPWTLHRCPSLPLPLPPSLCFFSLHLHLLFCPRRTLGWSAKTRNSHIVRMDRTETFSHFWTKSTNVFLFQAFFFFWWIKEVKCDWKTAVATFNLNLIIHDAHVVHTIIIDPSLYNPALNMQMRFNKTIEVPWRFIIYHLLTRDVQQTNCGIQAHVVLSLRPVMHHVVERISSCLLLTLNASEQWAGAVNHHVTFCNHSEDIV